MLLIVFKIFIFFFVACLFIGFVLLGISIFLKLFAEEEDDE